MTPACQTTSVLYKLCRICGAHHNLKLNVVFIEEPMFCQDYWGKGMKMVSFVVAMRHFLKARDIQSVYLDYPFARLSNA